MAEFLEFPNNKQQMTDTNLLFNKTKISPEIASMSSMSSMSIASSIRSSNSKKAKKPQQFIQEMEHRQPKKLINPNITKKPVSRKFDDDDEEEEEDDDDEDD